jgi:hypothetical protein
MLMNTATWVVLGVTCLLAGLWLWLGPGRRGARRLDDDALIDRVGLVAQPVLSRAELEWYNLIRLAVQDRYLVLSQVPLWVLVSMRTGDRSERAKLMGRLALKRVGFVLLHPGTGEIYKAIDIGTEQGRTAEQRRRDRLIAQIFAAAKIEHVRLSRQDVLSVPVVAASLGVEAAE